MKKLIIVVLLFTSLYAAEKNKISWDHLRIHVEINHKKVFTGDPVNIKLWVYNPHSFAVPLRYKNFIKVNNIVFRTKKSKISTKVTVPARQRLLLGQYKQKVNRAGIYKVYGFVKLKTRTLKSTKTVFQVIERKPGVILTRNSRLNTRLENRQGEQQQKTSKYRRYYDDSHCR